MAKGCMNIKQEDINKIIPYARNPRRNEHAVDYVSASIKEFGFQQPIVVDKDNVIIVGHTRLLAAKKLGLTEVPITVATELTKQQIKAYRIADNKVAEFSEFDNELLVLELQELSDVGYDVSATGFSDSDLKDLEFWSTREEGLVDDDFITETIKAITKTNDIYKLGRHKLICGDATNIQTIERLMCEEHADLVVTDPPFNVNYTGGVVSRRRLEIRNDNLSDEDFTMFIRDVYKSYSFLLKEGGVFYIFHSDIVNAFISELSKTDLMLKQKLIWVKNKATLSRQDYNWKHEPIIFGWKLGATHYFCEDFTLTTVIKHDKPDISKEHPTMKPVGLVEKLINNSSRERELIVDLFLGSGTTLIAAEKTGRRCFGLELDPHYCDIIVQRYVDYTGDTTIIKNDEEIRWEH